MVIDWVVFSESSDQAHHLSYCGFFIYELDRLQISRIRARIIVPGVKESGLTFFWEKGLGSVVQLLIPSQEIDRIHTQTQRIDGEYRAVN